MHFTIPQKRLLYETVDEILNLYNNPGTPGEKEAARQAYIRLTKGVDPSTLGAKSSNIKSTCDEHPDGMAGCEQCRQAQLGWWEIKARQHLQHKSPPPKHHKQKWFKRLFGG